MNDQPYPDPSRPPETDRTWNMMCHLSALFGLVIPPFGFFLGPLVIWLLKKNESYSVDQHGKEALNFQISMTIYLIIAGLMVFVVIGFLLVPVLFIMNLVFTVIAAIKASNGELYRYPLSIRFVE